MRLRRTEAGVLLSAALACAVACNDTAQAPVEVASCGILDCGPDEANCPCQANADCPGGDVCLNESCWATGCPVGQTCQGAAPANLACVVDADGGDGGGPPSAACGVVLDHQACGPTTACPNPLDLCVNGADAGAGYCIGGICPFGLACRVVSSSQGNGNYACSDTDAGADAGSDAVADAEGPDAGHDAPSD